jgi:hypothetical protein
VSIFEEAHIIDVFSESDPVAVPENTLIQGEWL